MSGADLLVRLQRRLDEDAAAPVYYTPAESLTALNWAQRLFVLLALPLQKTVPLELTANQVWYQMLATYADWLAPLRIRLLTGEKVHPARLSDLDGRNPTWQAAPGSPSRSVHLGFDLLGLDPHPSAAGTTVEITYAHSPADLSASSSSTPEIDEEYHPALIDAAITFLRTKEGGQEFQKSGGYFERFLSEAQRAAEYTLARNKAMRYDTLPWELRRFDRSRILDPAKAGRKASWLTT